MVVAKKIPAKKMASLKETAYWAARVIIRAIITTILRKEPCFEGKITCLKQRLDRARLPLK